MNAIELENIEHSYGKQKVLDNLSIHVPQGKIYGFLGPNGAGKTTTIRIILGLINHKKGRLWINGRVIEKFHHSARGHIGCIVEFPGFYPNLSGPDNLRAFQSLYGVKDSGRIGEVLKMTGLLEAGSKKVSAYSLGMKQRLGMARALLSDPNLLILDEPANGLDPAGIREMRQLFRYLSLEHGKTIFLSSHILSEIEQIVDNIGILKLGRMIEEISIGDLRRKCARGLQVRVANPGRVRDWLRQHSQIDCQLEPEGKYLIFQDHIDPASLNHLLVQNNFSVSLLSPLAQNIEEYFLNVT